jgi:hypothetical protein
MGKYAHPTSLSQKPKMDSKQVPASHTYHTLEVNKGLRPLLNLYIFENFLEA